MRSLNYDSRPVGFLHDRAQATTPGRIAATLLVCLFFGTAVQAQTPTPEENANQAHEDAEGAMCRLGYTCNNGRTAPDRGPDPCFLAQNAMRPCTPAQGQASKPVGVDPNIVGTWEIEVPGGLWVLAIHRDGTYQFHSEARDGAPSHAGSFSARDGQWSLTATTGYMDKGTYALQGSDTWIATGQLGIGAWRRQSVKSASRKQ